MTGSVDSSTTLKLNVIKIARKQYSLKKITRNQANNKHTIKFQYKTRIKSHHYIKKRKQIYSFFFIFIFSTLLITTINLLLLYGLATVAPATTRTINDNIYNQVRNAKQVISIVPEASQIREQELGIGQKKANKRVTVGPLDLIAQELPRSSSSSSVPTLEKEIIIFSKSNIANKKRSLPTRAKLFSKKPDDIEEDFSREEAQDKELDNDNDEKVRLDSERKTLNEFLSNLPTISVAQKHSVNIECDIDFKLQSIDVSFKLVWVKLTRPMINELSANSSNTFEMNDIKLISLNQKIITPDKRFKVTRQSEFKWTLSIDNVSTDDNQAYFLCQISSSMTSGNNNSRKKQISGIATQNNNSTLLINATQTKQLQNKNNQSIGYAGGAKLNVLVPPRILEQENSVIQIDEFERFSLKCKAVSEPQAQLIWKREDGKSLDYYDNVEQLFKHEIERRRNSNQIVSIDSSELIFNSVERHQAGAYLCIASNGVQPGVSQRTSVEVINCRSSSTEPASFRQYEPCEEAREQVSTSTTTPTTPKSKLSTATNPFYQQQTDTRRQRTQQASGIATNNDNNIRRNWKITSHQQINKQRLMANGSSDKRKISAANDITTSKQQHAPMNSSTTSGGSSSLGLNLYGSSASEGQISSSSLLLFITTTASTILFYFQTKLHH